MGLGLAGYFSPAGPSSTPGYTNPTDALAALDAWKNEQADDLGLAHTDVASAQLYPSTVGVWSSGGDPERTGHAPNGGRFPDTDLLTGLIQRGCTPMVYWNFQGVNWPGAWTSNLADWDAHAATWQLWADGTYDDFLDEYAEDAKNWAQQQTGLTSQGNPVSVEVILRLAGEMNASFFPWRTTDGQHKTNNTPTTFIAAWRHIHDRLRVVNGATHLKMFYCPWPSATAVTTITKNFPGTGYCQYIGADIYCDIADGASHASDTWANVQSLRSRFTATYNELHALSTTIPIIIGESGVTRANTVADPDVAFADADRKSWFTGTGWGGAGAAGGYAYVATNFTQVRNIVYSEYTQWAIDHATWPLTNVAYATLQNTYTTRMPGAYPRELWTPRGPVML